LTSERQSARMSKITNDSLTRSGTGCFIVKSYTHMATVGIKGLNQDHRRPRDSPENILVTINVVVTSGLSLTVSKIQNLYRQL